MKNFLLILLSFITLHSKAADFWLPATIQVGPDGSVTHTLPFPTSMDHFENDLGGRLVMAFAYNLWKLQQVQKNYSLKVPKGCY